MEFIFIQGENQKTNSSHEGLAVGFIGLIVLLAVVAIISRWNDKD